MKIAHDLERVGDEEVDEMTRRLRMELRARMTADPAATHSALNLMVVGKSLERVADHATNIAEMVVYLYEGRDIRHAPGEER